MSAGVKVSEPGMEGSVKNEEVFEAAKKMMGREFQTVLAALLKILPDYEDMLVENLVRPFILKDEDYKRLMDIMLGEFNKGLGKETNPTAKVKMYPTYAGTSPTDQKMGIS